MTIEKTRKVEPPDRWFPLGRPMPGRTFEFNPKLMKIRQPEKIAQAIHDQLHHVPHAYPPERFMYDVEIDEMPEDHSAAPFSILTRRREDGYESRGLRPDLKRDLLNVWVTYTTAPVSCLGDVPEHFGGRRVYCQSQHKEDW